MKYKILDKIDIFNRYIDLDIKNNKDISLCNGIGGVPVFYFLQYKLNNNKEYITKIQELISTIIHIINETEVTLSYCDGIVGVAHVFNYIRNKNILNPEFLCDIDDALLTIDNNIVDYYIFNTKKIEDIDFLHGSFGAAFYLIERLSENSDPIFKGKVIKLFEMLSSIVLDDIQKTNNVSVISTLYTNTHVTNCGLAHGHISYMIIFSKFLEKNPENNLIKDALIKSVKCVLQFKSNDEKSLSLFPGIAVNKFTANYNTHLGWCYGDQAISLGIYKSGCILNDKSLKDIALGLAYRNLGRNTYEKMFSSSDKYDACFCHGLSSVAYIHKKWYLITKDEKFYKEYEKLISDVLNFGDNKKGIAGYQKRLKDDTYTDSVALLDGVIGIGIVLIDYMLEFDDCGWDNFFLLDVNK